MTMIGGKRNPFEVAMEPVGIPEMAIAMPAAPVRPKPNWAGILMDALAGAMGKAGPYAAQMQQQQAAEQEDVRWGNRLEQQKQVEQKYASEKPYRWEANDGSLMEMGADGSPRVVYQDPTPKANLDPDVFITLPNGQVYAGPRSGLAAAMTGQAPGQTAPTPKPVGKLTPINGGPTLRASGTFRPSF